MLTHSCLGSPFVKGDHLKAIDEVSEVNGAHFSTPSFFRILAHIDEV